MRLESSDEAVIFGTDERLEYGAMSEVEQFRSRSVAIHVASSGVFCAGTSCNLTNQPLTTSTFGAPLCEGVRFRGQRWATAAECSAWLVAPNLVATAGHCLDQAVGGVPCAYTRYVFGFTAGANSTGETVTFSAADLYSCAEVVQFAFQGDESTDQDYALVRLDRDVPDRIPFIVNHTGQAVLGESVAVYGHPLGLPLKLSTNATIRNTTSAERVFFNGDVFGGNSGGVVVDPATGVAQALLVSQPSIRFEGSTDGAGFCHRYRVCADTGCTGSPDLEEQLTGGMRLSRVPGIPLHAALLTAVVM